MYQCGGVSVYRCIGAAYRCIGALGRRIGVSVSYCFSAPLRGQKSSLKLGQANEGPTKTTDITKT